jgi:hypothetical protein
MQIQGQFSYPSLCSRFVVFREHRNCGKGKKQIKKGYKIFWRKHHLFCASSLSGVTLFLVRSPSSLGNYRRFLGDGKQVGPQMRLNMIANRTIPVSDECRTVIIRPTFSHVTDWVSYRAMYVCIRGGHLQPLLLDPQWSIVLKTKDIMGS